MSLNVCAAPDYHHELNFNSVIYAFQRNFTEEQIRQGRDGNIGLQVINQ